MADERKISPMEPAERGPGAPAHQDHFISQSTDDAADRRNIRSEGSDDAPARDPDIRRAQGGPQREASPDEDVDWQEVHRGGGSDDEVGRDADTSDAQGGPGSDRRH